MLLSTNARTLLEDSGKTLLLSTAAVWEMGVKHALGRLRLPNNLQPAELIPEARPRNGVDTLPTTETDALQLPKRPRIHQDRSTGCSSARRLPIKPRFSRRSRSSRAIACRSNGEHRDGILCAHCAPCVRLVVPKARSCRRRGCWRSKHGLR